MHRIFLAILSLAVAAQADPILTSWLNDYSTLYARVIQSGTLTSP